MSKQMKAPKVSEKSSKPMAESSNNPKPSKALKSADESRRFWSIKFLTERGFLAEKPSEGFVSTVIALGWKEFVKHRKDFVVPLVREFYAGIPTCEEGKRAKYSVVRGEKVDFSPRAINEWFQLGYHGKSLENKVLRFGNSEMEEVKSRVCEQGAVWEKFGSEYRLLKAHLCDEAKTWFNFLRHSLVPTSHTTNVEKERLIVLDAILAKDSVDVGRLINKEIDKCACKKGGYLYFPCLITDLCIDVGVEVEAGEERRSLWRAFPTKFKPRQRVAAIVSSEGKTLQRLTLQQSLATFVKEKFEWEKAMFAHLSKGKTTVVTPDFPDWILEEEALEPKEKESVKEAGKRVRSPMKKKQEPAKKKKKIVIEEEEFDSAELDQMEEEEEEEAKEEGTEVLGSEEDESEEPVSDRQPSPVIPQPSPSPIRSPSPSPSIPPPLPTQPQPNDPIPSSPKQPSQPPQKSPTPEKSPSPPPRSPTPPLKSPSPKPKSPTPQQKSPTPQPQPSPQPEQQPEKSKSPLPIAQENPQTQQHEPKDQPQQKPSSFPSAGAGVIASTDVIGPVVKRATGAPAPSQKMRFKSVVKKRTGKFQHATLSGSIQEERASAGSVGVSAEGAAEQVVAAPTVKEKSTYEVSSSGDVIAPYVPKEPFAGDIVAAKTTPPKQKGDKKKEKAEEKVQPESEDEDAAPLSKIAAKTKKGKATASDAVAADVKAAKKKKVDAIAYGACATDAISVEEFVPKAPEAGKATKAASRQSSRLRSGVVKK